MNVTVTYILRIARDADQYHGKKPPPACKKCYHGKTYGLMAHVTSDVRITKTMCSNINPFLHSENFTDKSAVVVVANLSKTLKLLLKLEAVNHSLKP